MVWYFRESTMRNKCKHSMIHFIHIVILDAFSMSLTDKTAWKAHKLEVFPSSGTMYCIINCFPFGQTDAKTMKTLGTFWYVIPLESANFNPNFYFMSFSSKPRYYLLFLFVLPMECSIRLRIPIPIIVCFLFCLNSDLSF